MTISNILQKAKKELALVSSQPYQESVWLLAHTLNIESKDIYLESVEISPKKNERFWQIIQKRKKGCPLDYLMSEKHFLNHKFYVEPGVFIPRAETETLVNRIFKEYPKNKALKFMDWGCGSGTIALSLLSYFFKSKCLAVEIHPPSLNCLKKNQKSFKITDERIKCFDKDVSKIQKEDVNLFFKSPPDLITANPPYIDPKDKSISFEVYWFESPLALFSDQKGVGHIYSWFYKAMELLPPLGVYIFEFGWNQSSLVKKFLDKQKNLKHYEIIKDSLGYDRSAFIVK